MPHVREMRDRVNQFNWKATGLGSRESWPPSLRLIVDTILSSKFPMAVRWGPEFVLIYNDGYRPILGEKHPNALGLPFAEVWPEVQAQLGPLHQAILEGKSAGLFSLDLPLSIIRRHGGEPEEARFTVSYSPIPDAGYPSGVGGVLITTVERTAEVRREAGAAEAEEALREANKALVEERERITDANRRLIEETDYLRSLFEQAPGFMAVLEGPDHVFTFANAAYLKLVGQRELIGKSVKTAVPEVESQGFLELLDRVRMTGEAHIGQNVPAEINTSAGAQQLYLDFVFQPIRGEDHSVKGIFVQGHDLTELVRAQSALKESEERFRRWQKTRQ